MTMEHAIAVLRESGWKVDVDDAAITIVMQDPSRDVNWLHLLRQKDVARNEPRDSAVVRSETFHWCAARRTSALVFRRVGDADRNRALCRLQRPQRMPHNRSQMPTRAPAARGV